MPQKEIISVIIPAYNEDQYLYEAIESVQQQTIQPGEIIVIDDGSDDNTAEVVKSIRGNIRYCYQENKGIPTARNKGLKMAKGNLITFLDADDVWMTNKLELQLNLLREHQENEMVIGFLIMDSLDSDKNINIQLLNNEKGMFVLHLGSILVRKKVFDKIGIFDEEMILGEDTDWFFRVLESGIKVKVHTDVVQYYRQHDQNTTGDKKRDNYFLLKAFKKSIDRRRRSGKQFVNKALKFDNMDEIMEYWQSSE